MTPPALVYLGMGLIVARIILDGKKTRGFTRLQWMQYLVDAARIILLWPLVLLVDKVLAWLKSNPEISSDEKPVQTQHVSASETRLGEEQ